MKDIYVEKARIEEVKKLLDSGKVTGFVLIGLDDIGLFTSVHLTTHKQLPEIIVNLESMAENMRINYLMKARDLMSPVKGKKAKMNDEGRASYIG